MTLLTYLLTPWRGVLLEQLTGLQLVKKFSAFHGTRRFITALTSVRHLSLSWASPIQSTYPHPTSWRPILILSTHLRLGLPSGLRWQKKGFMQLKIGSWDESEWRSGNRIPMGCEIFRTRTDRSSDPTSLLYNVYRVTPEGKADGGVSLITHPTYSQAEMFLYSISGPWCVLGWI